MFSEDFWTHGVHIRKIVLFDFRMNNYFEPDLYNESINPVHKTGLNDLFLNVTGLVLEFSSVLSIQ